MAERSLKTFAIVALGAAALFWWNRRRAAAAMSARGIAVATGAPLPPPSMPTQPFPALIGRGGTRFCPSPFKLVHMTPRPAFPGQMVAQVQRPMCVPRATNNLAQLYLR